MGRLNRARTRAAPTPAITVSLAGGLGNQLFGYALGLELSRRHECPLRLQMGTLGSRECQLDKMALPTHVSFLRPSNAFADHAARFVGRIPLQRRIFQERSFRFDPRVFDLGPPVRLHGYFQSWRYFPTVGDEIRELVASTNAPSKHYIRLQRALTNGEGFIALHARRGDYLTTSEYHGVTSGRYFEDALATLRMPGKRVVLFTDEDSDWHPKWAPEGAIMIRPRDLPDARETLLLMSLADALVISNSSFAWWAAWIGDRPGRPVICPRPWFATPRLDTRDLLPLHWITIDLRGS